MSKNIKNYNELICRIKEWQPVLNDQHKLTAGIISAVESQTLRNGYGKPLRIVLWISSIAAVMFAGLFVSEYSTDNFDPANYISVRKVMTVNKRTLPTNISEIIRTKTERRKEIQTIYAKMAETYKIN